MAWLDALPRRARMADAANSRDSGARRRLRDGLDSPLVTLTTHLERCHRSSPPRREGDRIYGRGACDAKGIAAAMICAAE